MEFTLKQLSWIVIGSLGIGGTGYLTMNEKIDALDKKLLLYTTTANIKTKH